MSSTDTCVVRPELMEFQKYDTGTETSLYLSMVAHPSDGFKFTKKDLTSVNESDVLAMTYAADELADLHARQLFVSNIETNPDTTLRISTVTNLDMAVGGTGVIDLNHGNVTKITHMDFYEAGATTMMSVTNDNIVFGESNGLLNMTQGDIINVQNLNFATGSTTNFNDGDVNDLQNMTLTANVGQIDLNGGTIVMGGGTLNMNNGDIINATDLKVSEIRLHDINKIDNLNGNALVLEGVTFQDQDVTTIDNMTFVNASSSINLTNGTLDNVTFLNLNSDGSGVFDARNGDVSNVENMDFGSTLHVTREGSTVNSSNAPMIYNDTGAEVDLEGILFNSKDVSHVNNVTFTAGGAGQLDMSDGTVNNLNVLNMTAAGTLNMNNAHMDNLKTLNMNQMDFDGDAATIVHGNGGFLTLEEIEIEDKDIRKMDNITFSTGGVGTLNMSDGNVTNVHVQTMKSNGVVNMTNGTIDFNGSGALELNGGFANIAQLNITGSVIKNETGSMSVEESVFTDKQIKTLNINKLDSETDVFVENTKFDGDYLEVTNANIDVIVPKASGPLTLKADTTINLSNRSTTAAVRVTNVATPINDDDAANKGYVNMAVAENVQGLKPRKATDCSLFGGRHIGAGQGGATSGEIASDFDQATNVFGTFTKYAIEFAPAAPIDGVDQSELKFHLQGSGDVAFDGVPFNTADLEAIAASGVTTPELVKKRVLIMNLNETSINNAATYDGKTTFSTAFDHDDANLKGLNGIWEVYSYADTTGQTGWKTLMMKRARDMNESAEVLNGAYTYVKGGSRGNYGYVVASNDPLKIGTAGAVQGLTVDGSDALKEIEWIEFNNIDFELSFVNQDGYQKETLADVNATFRQGGIVMKYEATDEKQVMVNAEYLRYETDATASGGLALQVNGNVDFNLVAADAHINSNSDAEKVIVNGTKFERQGAVANINTTNIVANTVTCESDRNLKKNIKPMMNGLDLVSKLNAVTYHWKTDELSEREEYGFIAQEVEENFPTLVHTNPNTGVKSVDYQKMVSILALAVQELAAKLN